MVKCKKIKYIVKRLPITIEVEKNDIKAMFNVSLKDNNENKAVVAEFDEYYQIEVTKNDNTYFYIFKVIYLFVNSKYFSRNKPFKIKEKLIKFRKGEKYRNIVAKIKPYFL